VRDTVRYASDRNLAQAGVYLAAERGYFADQGLEVTFDRLTGPDLLTAVASGQVDVGGGPLGTGRWNAIARDLPLRIVAPMARQDPGANSTFLMIRKSLIDSGQYTDYPDLAGKMFAVVGMPNYFLARTLEHAGFPPGAARPVDLGQDFQAIS
jgi:NitT/TauT family transport system substrate-binding protein